MLDIQRYADLGHMKISWLDAHYHFSFANYHNPKRMGFGPLRVANDDIVSAGGGFDKHPHRDMEIITYVREGAITHEDSLGNRGVTKAGDVQVMAAGTGIVHAEWNAEKIATRLYQIWIEPRTRGRQPRWETRQFPKKPGELQLLASGLAEHGKAGAMPIDADAAIWGGVIAKDQKISRKLDGGGYLLVSQGEVKLDGETLRAGDGVAITGMPVLELEALAESELVLIDLPRLH